jgi:hypothetical protein
VWFTAACGRLGFGVSDDGDRDGDGVSDSLDNCPDLANPSQHDEDRDGFGDACDHCPHLPSATDPDQDGDGVGDACDPNPGSPGDSLSFVSFEDAMLPDGWVATSFTDPWTLGDDVAAVTLGRDHVAMLTMASPDSEVISVETEVAVLGVSPYSVQDNVARNVAIIDDYDVATDSGFLFGLVIDDVGASQDAKLEILRVDDGSGTASYGAPPPTGALVQPGQPYHLRYTRTVDQRTSEVDGLVGAPSSARGEASIGGGAGGGPRIGVRARGTMDQFHYVVVIASPRRDGARARSRGVTRRGGRPRRAQ